MGSQQYEQQLIDEFLKSLSNFQKYVQDWKQSSLYQLMRSQLKDSRQRSDLARGSRESVSARCAAICYFAFQRYHIWCFDQAYKFSIRCSLRMGHPKPLGFAGALKRYRTEWCLLFESNLSQNARSSRKVSSDAQS